MRNPPAPFPTCMRGLVRGGSKCMPRGENVPGRICSMNSKSNPPVERAARQLLACHLHAPGCCECVATEHGPGMHAVRCPCRLEGVRRRPKATTHGALCPAPRARWNPLCTWRTARGWQLALLTRARRLRPACPEHDGNEAILHTCWAESRARHSLQPQTVRLFMLRHATSKARNEPLGMMAKKKESNAARGCAGAVGQQTHWGEHAPARGRHRGACFPDAGPEWGVAEVC